MTAGREGKQVGHEKQAGDDQTIHDAFHGHCTQHGAHARMSLANDVVRAGEFTQSKRQCQDGHEADGRDDHQPPEGQRHADGPQQILPAPRPEQVQRHHPQAVEQHHRERHGKQHRLGLVQVDLAQGEGDAQRTHGQREDYFDQEFHGSDWVAQSGQLASQNTAGVFLKQSCEPCATHVFANPLDAIRHAVHGVGAVHVRRYRVGDAILDQLARGLGFGAVVTASQSFQIHDHGRLLCHGFGKLEIALNR